MTVRLRLFDSPTVAANDSSAVAVDSPTGTHDSATVAVDSPTMVSDSATAAVDSPTMAVSAHDTSTVDSSPQAFEQ